MIPSFLPTCPILPNPKISPTLLVFPIKLLKRDINSVFTDILAITSQPSTYDCIPYKKECRGHQQQLHNKTMDSSQPSSQVTFLQHDTVDHHISFLLSWFHDTISSGSKATVFQFLFPLPFPCTLCSQVHFFHMLYQGHLIYSQGPKEVKNKSKMCHHYGMPNIVCVRVC